MRAFFRGLLCATLFLWYTSLRTFHNSIRLSARFSVQRGLLPPAAVELAGRELVGLCRAPAGGRGARHGKPASMPYVSIAVTAWVACCQERKACWPPRTVDDGNLLTCVFMLNMPIDRTRASPSPKRSHF